jgi:hypothetical protein
MAGASPAATPTPLTAARHADPDDDATAQRDIATEDVADDEEQPEEEEQTAAGLIGQRDADEPEEEEEAASA